MDFARIVTEAKAERAELSARIEKLDALIAFAIDLAGGPAAPSARAAKVSTQRASNIMGPTREAVAAILRGARRPLGTAELVPQVIAAGVDVGGKNAVATLSARLSNGNDFTNNKGIGWWFTGEDIPGLPGSIFDEVEGKSDQGKPSTSVFQ